MRKVEELKILYNGYSNPQSRDEVVMEIYGLELAIKDAEKRIAVLKQSLHLSIMAAKAQTQDNDNAEIVNSSPASDTQAGS